MPHLFDNRLLLVVINVRVAIKIDTRSGIKHLVDKRYQILDKLIPIDLRPSIT